MYMITTHLLLDYSVNTHDTHCDVCGFYTVSGDVLCGLCEEIATILQLVLRLHGLLMLWTELALEYDCALLCGYA
jgi:hypothetical protein